MIDFERPLLERVGTIADIGDLGDRRARRAIDASGLYIVPFDPPGAGADGERGTLAPDMPAYFHLSRDPQGRDVVWTLAGDVDPAQRSEEHTSELQSLMRISYAVFCLKKKQTNNEQAISTIKHVQTTEERTKQ